MMNFKFYFSQITPPVYLIQIRCVTLIRISVSASHAAFLNGGRFHLHVHGTKFSKLSNRGTKFRL